jgi:hypothetical protein
MPDVGDPIQPLPVHERNEVRGMGRDAVRAVQPPCLYPAAQIHGQEPPAREPLRLELLDERAESVGASGEPVDQERGVLGIGVSPGDGVEVGSHVRQR